MVYLVRCSNSTVTDFYIDVIGTMFSRCGEQVSDYRNSESTCKSSIFVVSTVVDFFKLYLKGYRRIVYWMQGVEAEESYLYHESKSRRLVLNQMTKLALQKAELVFYVSETLRDYEERKFGISTKNKSVVMPCFNTVFDSSSVMDPEKYEKNVFSYVGSLSKWQCFEDTIDFYLNIEKKVNNCELRVFTSEQDMAKEILDRKGVTHYSIDFVAPDELQKKLYKVKFGFVLRDNIAVNNVATPTKLSSYMAAGVIPIFSDCIKDFNEQAKNLEYVVPVSGEKTVPEKLLRLCTEPIDASALGKEYADLFDTYYNPEYYIAKYSELIKHIINP